MSETKHPERRAVEVGQRRRNHKEIFTIYAIEGSHAIVCRAGQTDPVTDYVHKGDESCCWESISVLADCEIVADAPAIAPLATDMPNMSLPPGTITALDPGSQKMADQFQKYIDDLYRYSMPSYFIPAKDWTPPLAAQPAETKSVEMCSCSDVEHVKQSSCEPAPQPAPAKGLCLGCRKAICIGEYLSCREVVLHHREPMGKTTLTESRLPERLERPKLAHQAGMHDDDLTGGGR